LAGHRVEKKPDHFSSTGGSRPTAPALDARRARSPRVFDAHLDPEWEIYCQPHLNGLRPDFVLLNPSVGIAVFELKDWNLDAMHYFVPAGGRDLHGRKDGKSFSLAAQNPVTKVNHYRDAVYKLYCPRLKQNAGFAAVTAGVIFPSPTAGACATSSPAS
jgi:hypothetical protein